MTEPEQTPPQPPRTKGDKRERTRATLLEAARQLIREKGHDGATLEAIAERAGMTTGAIYGNFKNREDLFIALAQAYWAPIKPKVKPGATLADLMRAVADATIAAISERESVVVGRLTGMAYAISNEEMRQRVLAVTRESYAFGEEWISSVLAPDQLPMSAGQFVRVLHVMIEGFTFQRLLTPELISDKVIRAAFEALAKTL
ncbi:TetR/AcrR family transcriptional regulator [Occallatibacter savannae]|uniref:TetR/AcrR family transcriptional regulator n=1 Tax=Occallatibacter savannae TaxID=1002691 RepID=UPI000D6918B7|nr:TetR/AcrR family transcriptional regulator [Occallatibacter savannae]